MQFLCVVTKYVEVGVHVELHVVVYHVRAVLVQFVQEFNPKVE